MESSFAEVLEKLKSPACGTCRHEIGSESCFDEDAYEQLGVLFNDAVAAFTATDGPPIQTTLTLPGEDVERIACWRRGETVLYAMLSWGDNTRVRYLTLGLAARGVLVVRETGTDHWLS